MKKLIAAIAIAVTLSGCAQMGAITTGISLATKSVANPVTENELYEIEAGVSIVVKGLVAYRRACLAGSADKNCRANIAAIQVYTRQLPPYLTQLRTFVRQNDQVNAVVVYNTLTSLLAQAKQTAANLGVNIGG